MRDRGVNQRRRVGLKAEVQRHLCVRCRKPVEAITVIINSNITIRDEGTNRWRNAHLLMVQPVSVGL